MTEREVMERVLPVARKRKRKSKIQQKKSQSIDWLFFYNSKNY
jgi:hypothetical protein